jgi:hypothetical protein
MMDVATGWTECLPLVNPDGCLVVEALKRAQSLFPWLLCGVDFDNGSAFMTRWSFPGVAGRIEVTRSRAYRKNDQAFVEQKNGAVVRRLMGIWRRRRDGSRDGPTQCDDNGINRRPCVL